MSIHELRTFDGQALTSCTYCKRRFADGEVITVSDGQPFCHSDGDGGCMILDVFRSGVMRIGNAEVFCASAQPADHQTLADTTGRCVRNYFAPLRWVRRALRSS